jgi:hypothetical protein
MNKYVLPLVSGCIVLSGAGLFAAAHGDAAHRRAQTRPLAAPAQPGRDQDLWGTTVNTEHQPAMAELPAFSQPRAGGCADAGPAQQDAAPCAWSI